MASPDSLHLRSQDLRDDPQGDHQPRVSRLLQLPPELRHYIIRLSFLRDAPNMKGVDLASKAGRDYGLHPNRLLWFKPRQASIFIKPSAAAGLLQVNHQLRHEARIVLHQMNRATPYHLDIRIVIDINLYPVWLYAITPMEHIETVRTTVRVLEPAYTIGRRRLYAQEENHGINPYATALLSMLVRYLQQKPRTDCVSPVSQHAVNTIGTLIFDVLTGDDTEKILLNPPKPEPDHDTPLREWHLNLGDFEEPLSDPENLAWSIWRRVIDLSSMPQEWLKYWKTLLDGVSTIEVRLLGKTRKKVHLWKIMEADASEIDDKLSVDWAEHLRDWKLEAQQRRKDRGLWIGGQ